MNKGRLQWYNVGNEELQARSYAEAVRIVKHRKAFEKKQKGNENGIYLCTKRNSKEI